VPFLNLLHKNTARFLNSSSKVKIKKCPSGVFCFFIFNLWSHCELYCYILYCYFTKFCAGSQLILL